MKIIQELYLNLHGQEIPVANIRPYLRPQPAAPKQETEQQIFWRVIKLNNIELLRTNKQHIPLLIKETKYENFIDCCIVYACVLEILHHSIL